MPKTVIIMPTYNEAENLPKIAREILALPIDDLHILVVDDNSPDGTGQLAEDLAVEYAGRVGVLHRQEKQGLGPAYMAGFKRALDEGADYLVQMDTDFSHQPKYLLQFVDAAQNPDVDIVIGSRYVPGGGVDENWSLFRKALSYWANIVYVKLWLNMPVRDATGGFRLWKRETIVGIDLERVRSNGYVFQVETAYIAHRLGYRFTEIPIYFPDRSQGTSKMTFRIQREAALRVIQVMIRHRGLSPTQRRTQAYTS